MSTREEMIVELYVDSEKRLTSIGKYKAVIEELKAKQEGYKQSLKDGYLTHISVRLAGFKA